ncbi:MAG: hypothetical protein JW973_11570 [Bacteroidales bacterium]|nr:hypothetical protein [Bacteroidales bacterium]
MKSIIKIAILTFLLRNSISGQKGINKSGAEFYEMDWLINSIEDDLDDDFVRWFTAEKTMDTESVSIDGNKLVQIWLPVQYTEDNRHNFRYFNN